MGTLGVLLGLATLIVAALRGVNILIVSLIAAGIVAVSNGRSWSEAFTVDYTGAMMGFAGAFFVLFLTGAIFGRVMADSGAAQSIGLALRQLFGDERALLVIVVASAGLTYGGVNVFVVVFAIYPLALGLVARANLPKRLLVAATGLGAGTFTMTALPASPSVQNNISANALGTPLTAQPQRHLAHHGTTYSRLVEEVRFELARDLLQDPDVRARDVSGEAGYSDAAHFTRAFRRFVGVTPGKYRRLLEQ